MHTVLIIAIYLVAVFIAYRMGHFHGQLYMKKKIDAIIKALYNNFKEQLSDKNSSNASLFDTATGGNTDKQQRILDLIAKASNISNQQADLYMQTSLPSKGASHSRWKNDIINKIKQLDTEKYSTLKKILSEGYDPKVAVIGDSGRHEQKYISELVEEYDQLMTKEEEDNVTSIDRGDKKKKLKLIKNTDDK